MRLVGPPELSRLPRPVQIVDFLTMLICEQALAERWGYELASIVAPEVLEEWQQPGVLATWKDKLDGFAEGTRVVYITQEVAVVYLYHFPDESVRPRAVRYAGYMACLRFCADVDDWRVLLVVPTTVGEYASLVLVDPN